MERLPSIRASDTDREQAAERLRHATAEGRLSPSELEERLEALFAARTYGEIDALLADLPFSRSPSRRPPVRVAEWVGAAAAFTLVVSVLGMVAVMHRIHDAVVDAHLGQLGPLPPLAGRHHALLVGPHHPLLAAASMVGVLAFLATCVALVWVLMRSKSSSNA